MVSLDDLTLEQKVSLLSGKNFWQTQDIPDKGIPALCLTDGPHGVRMARPDGQGFFDSLPATCFPTASALASSWDVGLLERIGEALGQECRSLGVHVLLGPGANLKRSPLCGRNFEYFSEDPYLSGQLAAAHIRGVQKQGIGTSLKHFAANNQEHRRLTVSAEIDERALREIYLASFESAIKGGNPWTVMCAYNRINGVYCSENPWLLTKVLRDDWGFDGVVVSDWGAVNDRVAGVQAGLDLEMPGGPYTQDDRVAEAVHQGELDEACVDQSVARILQLIERVYRAEPDGPFDVDRHHELARQAARECIVLLKNEGHLLPIARGKTVAVIGEFAVKPRYQGGGSSHVNPTKLDEPLAALKAVFGADHVRFAPGYRVEDDEPDTDLVREAVEIAKAADIAVIFAGLPQRYESEGYDRSHLRMPAAHNALIEAVAEAQPQTVVVLSNGAPVEMPWVDAVPAIVEGYLGGQGFGQAIADVLAGVANPCGKLAETFPVKLEHNPSHPFFPGEGDRVEYREGIFVGYRYYDAKHIEPLFPFGHGLSYTTFAYRDMKLSRDRMRDDEVLEVTAVIENTGERAGKEIVQLYVGDDEASVARPPKELKAFAKVELEPGERKEVVFRLDKRAFAFWDVDLGDWRVETGTFTLYLGASSRDIRLTAQVTVESTTPPKPLALHENTTVGDLMADPVLGPAFRAMLDEFLAESPLGPMQAENAELFEAFMRYTPIGRAATLMNVPREQIQAVLARLREVQQASMQGGLHDAGRANDALND